MLIELQLANLYLKVLLKTQLTSKEKSLCKINRNKPVLKEIQAPTDRVIDRANLKDKILIMTKKMNKTKIINL